MSIAKRIFRQAYYTYLGCLFTVSSRRPIGTNVYDREWDVLAILDTCRVDALREVAPEYEWLSGDEIDKMLSVGSGSSEWMMHTFTDRYRKQVENTAFIACNAYARRIFAEGYSFDEKTPFQVANWQTLSSDDFALYHCVWDHVPFYQPGGHTDPQITTDRALDAIEETTPGRTVLHYQRPHHPYNSKALEQDRDELKRIEKEPFAALKAGEAEFEEVWDLYLEELRTVLDEVGRLRKHVNGTVAISADHGEAFGEFGVYGHPTGVFHPKIRFVPWVTVRGEGRDNYTIKYPLPKGEDSSGEKIDTEEQLRNLGYI